MKDRNCIRILFHSKPGSAENQEIVVPPEYNSVVFQIQDDIYIQLFTVVAPKSRDICQPFFIDVFCYKLSVQNISAGSLSLPTSDVLQIVKAYDLPDFVQVESKKNQVVINLSKINVSGNLYIKANQIDLAKGNFVFDFMKKA